MRSHIKKHGQRPFRGSRFVENRHGRLVVRIEWWPNGQRKCETIGPNTKANREMADQVLARALERAAKAAQAPQGPLTMEALLRAYREDAGKRRAKRTGAPLRAPTLQLYDGYHARITAFFGPEKIAAEVRRSDVRLFEQRLCEHVGDGQVVRTMDHLRQVYRWAVAEAELLTANPIADVRSSVRRPRHGPIYTRTEARALLDGLAAEGRDWRFRLMVLLCGTHGMREGQARGLRWPDVDFDQRTLRLRQAVQGSKGQPDRVVPMLGREHLALLEAWNRRAGDDGHVLWGWQDATGPVSYDGMNRSLHALEERVGVPTIKGRAWHAFRRAIATELATELGPAQAAAWIGDTMKTTTEVYVQPGAEAMNQAAKYVGTASEPRPPAEGVG